MPRSPARAAKKVLGGAKRARSKRISEKIPVLMAEGKTQKQAVGEAYGMEKAGRLRRRGVYVPTKKK